MLQRIRFSICMVLAVLAGGSASAAGLSGSIVSPPQIVFDTKSQSCEHDDIPDGGAIAFRDFNNTVHMISGTAVVRANIGPNLNQLHHSCDVVFRSKRNPNPADFQHYSWFTGFYTADGRNIAMSMHDEFRGWLAPGMCSIASARPGRDCFWVTTTYSVSHDGGYSFSEPEPPRNLIASVPYRFSRDISSPVGYGGLSSIVRMNSYFYAMMSAFKYEAQPAGNCVLRTTDPFDPKSWRAWDGSGFNVQFVDPYRETVADPAGHVCAPVAPRELSEMGTLRFSTTAKLFVRTELARNRAFGEPGIYLTTSSDLIHWSPPTLLLSNQDMLAHEPPGSWLYLYPSLLDPASTDRNFTTIGDNPYLYYVRLDRQHGPYVRVLERQTIHLSLGG
jgi:hypothetical protein